MKRLDTAVLRQFRQEGRPLAVAAPETSSFPVRVVQFGEGNFLRAFVDWMFDELHRRGLFNGRVQIVQPLPTGLVEALNEQDGLYTVMLRGLLNGRPVEQTHLITSVAGGLNPYSDWRGFLALAANPDLRFMVSNTTEAGIAYVAEPIPTGTCPESFPAKVTMFLFERYRRLGGMAQSGLVILPCELIEANGARLKGCVLRHAESWRLEGGFRRWLDEHNRFLNTLVDRIVPGYPHEEAERIFADLGYEDRLLTTGEPFHLWVIQGPPELSGDLSAELPFDRIGLNVVWTDDLAPFRTRKVRLLNGGHTSSVLAAFLAGCDTVGEMMQDELTERFLRRAVFDEILPVLKMEPAATAEFARAVFERFRNPFIRHRLLDIALNSVSKWRVRVLPSLEDYFRQRGELPKALTFSLAALLRFYRPARIEAETYWGDRDGQPYPLRDDRTVLTSLADAWRKADETGIEDMVATILARAKLWGCDLREVPGFAAVVARNLRAICERGMRPALQAIL